MKKLNEFHEKKIRTEIEKRLQTKPVHTFPNGWFSTNKENPEAGHIYTPVENGEIISFKDKSGVSHVGVVNEIVLEKSTMTYSLNVVCHEQHKFEVHYKYYNHLVSPELSKQGYQIIKKFE